MNAEHVHRRLTTTRSRLAMAESTVALCACGCGHLTRPYSRNDYRYGHVKGEYAPYLRGHKPTTTYKQVRHPTLPRRCAFVHRLRAECVLGKPLPSRAVVHHPDEDPWNPTARLVVCENQGYHRLLHARMRVKAAGGNPNTDRVCCVCHMTKPFAAFAPTNCATSRAKYMSPCRECDRQAQRRRRAAHQEPR